MKQWLNPNWWLLFACLSGFSPQALTATPDPQQAQAVIERTASEMQSALRENVDALKTNPAGMYDLVADILLPRFNFDLIAQLVLGKHWRKASSAQRQSFTDEFRTLMVRTYGNTLLDYVDADLRYLSVRPSKRENRVTVRSEVRPAGASGIPIDYTMCHDGGQWRVCNVTIDRSINFVVNYRKQINDQIRRQGLDKVIAKLSQTNTGRSPGNAAQ